MALKVGELYVSLSANLSNFSKGMDKALAHLEKVAGQVKRLANDVSQLGRPLAAVILGAVAASAQANAQMNAEVNRLKDTFLAMAAEIGEAFLPAIREVNDVLLRVLGFFQRLSPETKALIVDWGILAIQVTGGAMALSKVALALEVVAKAARMANGAIGKLTKAFGPANAAAGGFAKALTPVLIPVLAIAAALAGIVLAAGALKLAWQEFGDAIKSAMSSAWTTVKEFVSKAVDGFKLLLRVMKPILKQKLGIDVDAITAKIEAWAGSASEFASGVKDTVVDGAKAAGGAALDGLEQSYNALGKGLVDKITGFVDGLQAKISGAVDAVTAGPDGTLPTTSGKLPELQMAETFDPLYFGKAIESVTDAFSAGMESRRKAERAYADRVTETLRASSDYFVGRLRGAFSGISNVIDSASNGAALGGAFGAVAGVAFDLVTRSEQFRTVIGMLEQMLTNLSTVLAQFLEPLQPVIGALSMIGTSIASALAPVLNVLGPIIEALAPPMVMIAGIFSFLAPVLQWVAKAAGFLVPVFKVVFEVLKVVANVVGSIMIAIGDVWNGILGAIEGFLRMLGGIEIFGAKPFEFLNQWADGLKGAMMPTDQMREGLAALNGMTWEQAQAAANATAEQLKNTAALKEATESLTNVPEGYKVALARFNAQDPLAGSGPSAITPIGPAGETSTESAPVAPIIINVNGTTDPAGVAREVMRELEREQYRRTRSTYTGPTRFVVP